MRKPRGSKRPIKQKKKRIGRTSASTADDYINLANEALAEIKVNCHPLASRKPYYNLFLSLSQLDSAAEFYNQALALRSDDCNIMDALADVYLQLGQPENATELLLRRCTPVSHLILLTLIVLPLNYFLCNISFIYHFICLVFII